MFIRDNAAICIQTCGTILARLPHKLGGTWQRYNFYLTLMIQEKKNIQNELDSTVWPPRNLTALILLPFLDHLWKVKKTLQNLFLEYAFSVNNLALFLTFDSFIREISPLFLSQSPVSAMGVPPEQKWTCLSHCFQSSLKLVRSAVQKLMEPRNTLSFFFSLSASMQDSKNTLTSERN
jgi:hypothetical protein